MCTIFKPCTETEDFNPLSVELEFYPESSKVCYIVDIIIDGVLEGNENFTAVLIANDTQVIVSPGSATITIMDGNSE